MKQLSFIANYSQGFPSATSRYVIYRELIRANAWYELKNWDESVGLKYIRYQEDKGLSPFSIKIKAERVSRYFDWLIKNKNFKKSNPINKRFVPKFRDERTPQALTIDETKLFLKQIPQATWIGCRDKTAISLMLVNGLRIGSVCSLRWSDIEMKNNQMQINIKSKGNVMSTRQLRPDVVEQLKKLYLKTYGEKYE